MERMINEVAYFNKQVIGYGGQAAKTFDRVDNLSRRRPPLQRRDAWLKDPALRLNRGERRLSTRVGGIHRGNATGI
jgi:hypothetical protein